jgi:hypothetical protein
VYWLLGSTKSFWASETFSPAHPYAISFKFGARYYFRTWLGIYLDFGLFAHVGLFLVLIVMMARYQRRRPDSPSGGAGLNDGS